MMKSLPLLALLSSGCATLHGGASSGASADSAAVVRTFTDAVYNQKKLARVPEFIAPDFVDRSPDLPADARGPAFVRRQAEANLETFPDLRYTLHHLVAEGDLVATRWSTVGTDARSVQLGAPRTVTVQGQSFYRLSGGKIVEAWDVVDRLGAFRQMGFSLVPPAKLSAPAPASPPAAPRP